MIGQTEIINYINNIQSIDDLSRSIVISGPFGIGRHTLFKYICDKFNFDIEEINYDLSLDILNDMYSLSIPKMYLVDFDRLKESKQLERFQNTLLKFIEEPPKFAWITIIVPNCSFILETVLNRCKIFYLSSYSLNELSQIANLYGKVFSDEELIKLSTPYNIINITSNELEQIQDLIDNIINNMHRANLSNALSIKKKFDSEIDIFLFIHLFIISLHDIYLINNDKKYFNIIKLTQKLTRDLYVLNVNKSYLIENYLLNLKLLFDD